MSPRHALARPPRRHRSRARIVSGLSLGLLAVSTGVALACIPPHPDPSGGNSGSGTTSTTSTPTPTAVPTTTPSPTPTAPPTSAPPTSPPTSIPPTSTPPTTEPGQGPTAAERHGWGTPLAKLSDEFNDTRVDLTKWGLFGAGRGQGSDSGACSPGYDGHGQRCASQTTEGAGHLTVRGGAGTPLAGGLYSVGPAWRYGRIEVRERAFSVGTAVGTTGHQYHAVPLLFPATEDYTRGEIDYAERDVGAGVADLFVHHDGTQAHCSARVDTTAWHTYALDWQPHSVTWFVDGAQVCRVAASVPTYNAANATQLDAFDGAGMRAATAQVDWLRFYPTPATQYRDPDMHIRR